MVYRGRVEKGVVVLEGEPALPAGTVVRVEAEGAAASAPRGSWEAIKALAGTWAGDPAEIDRSLAELREMKAAEVRRQQAEPEPER